MVVLGGRWFLTNDVSGLAGEFEFPEACICLTKRLVRFETITFPMTVPFLDSKSAATRLLK